LLRGAEICAIYIQCAVVYRVSHLNTRKLLHLEDFAVVHIEKLNGVISTGVELRNKEMSLVGEIQCEIKTEVEVR
jgi:hypothetical protein